MTNKLFLLLAVLFIGYFSCRKDEIVNDGVIEVIDRDIVIFNPGNAPKQFL